MHVFRLHALCLDISELFSLRHSRFNRCAGFGLRVCLVQTRYESMCGMCGVRIRDLRSVSCGVWRNYEDRNCSFRSRTRRSRHVPRISFSSGHGTLKSWIAMKVLHNACIRVLGSVFHVLALLLHSCQHCFGTPFAQLPFSSYQRLYAVLGFFIYESRYPLSQLKYNVFRMCTFLRALNTRAIKAASMSSDTHKVHGPEGLWQSTYTAVKRARLPLPHPLSVRWGRPCRGGRDFARGRDFSWRIEKFWKNDHFGQKMPFLSMCEIVDKH